ncbi:hypothetical protein SAMN05660653_01283 [Desulfonatronum thiosulfatophilum]|uniref:tRNA_anti-like n=1 Tax=Desulfonatronum thiosulfatophilum TaxID=617002 RepID=A0A1G6C1H2_9BACT|nr:hypothetical protein [Desulfonatronum thiosulfatophilum]SDB26711.1 hypothetical protein SAMN05660653_01283 [Desulfonatronum thiosulfatophilum]
MRKYVLVFSLISISVIGLAVFNPTATPALNVNDVAFDPLAYTGNITIRGVTGAVSNQDPSIFGIMDVKELRCTVQGCEKVFLPIKYTGKRPSMGDEVVVAGSFTENKGTLIFDADSVQIVRNHNLGG